MMANVFKMGLGSAEQRKLLLGVGALGLHCLGAGVGGALTWDLPEGR